MIKKYSSIKCGGGDDESVMSIVSRHKKKLEQQQLNIRLMGHLQSDKPNIEVIKNLLDKGADPNAENVLINTYETITDIASMLNGIKMLELLLDYKLNPDLRDPVSGDTLLHFAIKSRYLEMVKLLVKYGCSVNMENYTGKFPIIYAIQKNQPDILEYLLQNGADPNAITSQYSGLHIAAYHNLFKIVELLLKYDADISYTDENGETAFTYAIEKNHNRIIQTMLPYLNIYELKMGLELALVKHDLKLVKFLMRNDAFQRLYEDEDLFYNIMTMFVENFLNTLNDQDMEILKWLTTFLGKDMFTSIIQNEPYIFTELIYIYSTDVNKIKFLISLGADVGAIHPLTRETSLITSAKNPYTNIEIVKCLIENVKGSVKEFINIENIEGETALILFTQSPDIVKYLIENGGDINYKNNLNETFFMHACKSSMDITYLIEQKAEINHQSNEGETALMWAIMDENIKNVRILLENNADVQLKTKNGENALDIAIKINNANILRLLSEYIMENGIYMDSKYNKLLSIFTSENRLKWQDACKIKDETIINDMKAVYNIKETQPEKVCDKLEEEEQNMIKRKNDIEEKCINSDNLDGEDVKEMSPEHFYAFEENGVTYCEDIRALFKLLKSFSEKQKLKNPYTGKLLSKETINDINEQYKKYNIISTGKEDEENEKVSVVSSKDILIGQLSMFYSIMKNMSSKDIFLSSTKDKIELFILDLQNGPLNIFIPAEFENIKNTDIDKYKYQLVKLLLSKIVTDKYKYTEGEVIIYPTREFIRNIWNKIFI